MRNLSQFSFEGATWDGWEARQVRRERATQCEPPEPDALGGRGQKTRAVQQNTKGSETKKQPCGNLHITANYANRQARSGAKHFA